MATTMSVIIDTQTLKNVSFEDVRVAYPNTSFSRPLRANQLNGTRFAIKHETNKPEGDVVTEGAPVQQDDGEWYQTWHVRNYTDAELDTQRETLRETLADVHDAACGGATVFRGVSVAIDVEARINAQGTLAAIRAGRQILPLQWYHRDQSIEIASVDDMQVLHDAIFAALQTRFAAKGRVLTAIENLSRPFDYNVETAYQAALSQ